MSDALSKLLAVLPWWDWAALAWFFAAWIGYARFARRHAPTQPSLLAAGNRVRQQWMLQSTRRDVRVLDAIVVQNLSTSPSFFASTTILIVGGLLALLGSADHTSNLVTELPFAARTSALVLDLKLVADRYLRLCLLPLYLEPAPIQPGRDVGGLRPALR